MPPCHIWWQLYLLVFQNLVHVLDHTVAGACIYWSFNMDVKVWYIECLCGIYGIQSGSGMGYSLSASVIFCQYSTSDPYLVYNVSSWQHCSVTQIYFTHCNYKISSLAVTFSQFSFHGVNKLIAMHWIAYLLIKSKNWQLYTELLFST